MTVQPVIEAVSHIPWWKRYTLRAAYLTQENPWLDLAHCMIDSTYLSSSIVSYREALLADNPANIDIASKDFIHEHILFCALLMLFVNVFGIAGARFWTSRWCAYVRDTLWPQWRKGLSGVKNGRHATVNAGFIVDHLAKSSGYHCYNPIGIGIGVLTAFVMCHYHALNAERETLHAKHFESVVALEDDPVAVQPPVYQMGIFRYLCRGYAVLDGAVDGGYLFGCLLLLFHFGLATALTGGLPLYFVTAGILIYTAVSVICKYQAERDMQYEVEALAEELRIKQLEVSGDSDLGEAKTRFIKQYRAEPGQIKAKIEIAKAKAALDKAFQRLEKAAQQDLLNYRMHCDWLFEAEQAFFNRYGNSWQYFLAQEGVSLTLKKAANKVAAIEKTNQTLVERMDVKAVSALVSQFHSLREKQRAYAETYKPRQFYYGVLMRALWHIERGILSGAKNANAAVAFVGLMIRRYVVMPVLMLAVGAVLMVFYGLFLGLKEGFKVVRQCRSGVANAARISTNQSTLWVQEKSAWAQGKKNSCMYQNNSFCRA